MNEKEARDKIKEYKRLISKCEENCQKQVEEYVNRISKLNNHIINYTSLSLSILCILIGLYYAIASYLDKFPVSYTIIGTFIIIGLGGYGLYKELSKYIKGKLYG